MQSSTSVGNLLEHVAAILHRQADQVLQERLGVGLSQLKILELLEVRPQTSQRKLADFLGQTEASVSRQIKVLSGKGLVTTRVDVEERRRHLSVLSPKGLKVTVAAHEVLDVFYQQVSAQFNKREQEQLEKLLAKLHDISCAPGKRLACDRPDDTQSTVQPAVSD